MARLPTLKHPSWLLLDLLALPGRLQLLLWTLCGCRAQGLRANALWHLRWCCPRCPARRALRDPTGPSDQNDTCFWERRWQDGQWTIPPDFGVCRWLRQYLD